MGISRSGEGMRAERDPFAFGTAVEGDIQDPYLGTSLKPRRITCGYRGYESNGVITRSLVANTCWTSNQGASGSDFAEQESEVGESKYERNNERGVRALSKTISD